MKKKLVIVIALLLGAISVLLVNYYLKQKEREYAAVRREKETTVLMAVKEIPAGARVEEDMVRLVSIPEKYIQPKAAQYKERAVGRFALVPVIRGEQILMTKLGTEEEVKRRTEEKKRKIARLSMNMPLGKRAVTIALDATGAVGGSVNPGDHVDVLAAFSAAKLGLQPEAKSTIITLFQDILVLAVTGSSVTLALTPEQAGIITVAQNEGRLLLALRPQAEAGEHSLPLVNMNTLLEKYTPAVAAPAEPEPEGIIEIFRGLQKETIPVSSIPKKE